MVGIPYSVYVLPVNNICFSYGYIFIFAQITSIIVVAGIEIFLHRAELRYGGWSGVFVKIIYSCDDEIRVHYIAIAV